MFSIPLNDSVLDNKSAKGYHNNYFALMKESVYTVSFKNHNNILEYILLLSQYFFFVFF